MTVGPAGQPDVAFVLMAVPGAPGDRRGDRRTDPRAPPQGAVGALFVTTDDVQETYEELKGRGVEFTSEPTRMPYGIDAPFRDPFGNEFRLVQQLVAA